MIRFSLRAALFAALTEIRATAEIRLAYGMRGLLHGAKGLFRGVKAATHAQRPWRWTQNVWMTVIIAIAGSDYAVTGGAVAFVPAMVQISSDDRSQRGKEASEGAGRLGSRAHGCAVGSAYKCKLGREAVGESARNPQTAICWRLLSAQRAGY
jgi:hypothetical protein